MPCNTDHMEPTVAERQTREGAAILVYVLESLGKDVIPEIRSAASDIYGRGAHPSNIVGMLCTLIKNMTEEEKDRILFNGRNAMARRAADWWDEHQREDAKRDHAKFLQDLKRRYPNHVFVVTRNADMVEGRGPMVYDSVHKTFDDAYEYIKTAKGVMGHNTPGVRHNEKSNLHPEFWEANAHRLVPSELR